MQKIGEIINIANKVFIKNIKKQIKEIKDSQFRDEVKNNLSMAGELMIDSIYILGCKALYLFFCIFTNKPVYCDYDGKRSNHAEECM